MASTSAWALIGARSRYDIGIEATHLLQVIDGDRLVLEIRSLHEHQEITRWIPPSPQTVDIAMRALIAVTVQRTNEFAVEDDSTVDLEQTDLPRLSEIANRLQDLFEFSVYLTVLPTSSLEGFVGDAVVTKVMGDAEADSASPTLPS